MPRNGKDRDAARPEQAAEPGASQVGTSRGDADSPVDTDADLGDTMQAGTDPTDNFNNTDSTR